MKEQFYSTLTKSLSRMLKTPQYLILFVSDACWMKCAHCWYNETWKENNLKSSVLSFDELERIADSIDRIYFLSLTGGEAFMRKDLIEIAAMFNRKTKLGRYQIPTSGFDTDRIVSSTEKMLQINRAVPFRVDVSLDGTEDTHNHIRRIKNGYKNCLETVRQLNKVKDKYAYFDVGIITTISNANQHEVKEIAEVVRKINPNGEWMVNITRGKTRDEHAGMVDPAEYFEAHKIIEQRIKNRTYVGHTGHFTASWLSAKNATRRKVIKDIVTGKREGGGCAAGALGGVIYNDGEVKACEMLDESFGNLRNFNYDLRRLWNSPKADQIRKMIQETKCQCTQECFLSISLLIQPQYWPDIVYNRLKLLFTSKIYSKIN